MRNVIFILLLVIRSLYAGTISEKDHPEIYCLSEAIYFEARGSSYADRAAVADVIMNRVESKKFPHTVCGVVRQAKMYNGYPVKNKCQFSYFCDGKSDDMLDLDSKHKAQLLAYNVIRFRRFRGITEGATFYHAVYVKPYWAKSFRLTGTIGSHKFYTEY